jgi:predicted nucleotidyltransferase
MMHPLDEKTLSIILEAFHQAGFPEDTRLFLFGSRTTPNPDPRSDLDLALKAPEPIPLSAWACFEEALENSDLTFRVDVVDYRRVKEDFRKVIDTGGMWVG